DLRPQPRGFGVCSCFCILILVTLKQQRLDRVAPLLCCSDFSRDAVTPGLSFLGTSLRGAPRAIENKDLLCAGRQPTPGQTAVEFVWVFPDPSEIVHRATGYREPWASRPSGLLLVRCRERVCPCRRARPPLRPPAWHEPSPPCGRRQSTLQRG